MTARKPRQPSTVTDEESVKKKIVPPADKSKMKEKSTKPTPSKKANKGKAIKVQKGKRFDCLVDEADEEPLPTFEPPVDDDEYNLQ
nr:hypothetical protein [Tanacetum cinerariifolium]